MRSTIGSGKPSSRAIRPHFILPARRMALRIMIELLLVARSLEITAPNLSSAIDRVGRMIGCKAHATRAGGPPRAFSVSSGCLSVPAENAGEPLLKGDGRLVAEVAASAAEVGPRMADLSLPGWGVDRR